MGRRNRIHVRLSKNHRLFCNICNEEVLGDPHVALAGNASSTALQMGFINPFHHVAIHAVVGKWHLCKGVNYLHRDHGPSRPGCIFHSDCLHIFMRNCTAVDALNRLWQTCFWRRAPWTGGARVPELRLRLLSVWYYIDAFVFCGRQCGFPLLDTLPHLVIASIMELVPRGHYIWRCVTAVELAKRLSIAPSEPLRSAPLSELVSWERGGQPTLAAENSSTTLPRIIRLTVDLDGLKKVERLSEPAPFGRQRYDDRAFVVEEKDRFGGTVARFKNGLMQLVVSDCSGFDAWDTPTPPDLTRCLSLPRSRRPSELFHTIDLGKITGLTFFVHPEDCNLMAVHAHSWRQPCARDTYTSSIPHRYANWIYVPLPPGDEVLRCGPSVKRSYYQSGPFMIRTRLSGETVIGRFIPHSAGTSGTAHQQSFTFLLSSSDTPVTTLVYHQSLVSPLPPLLTLGAYDGLIQARELVLPSYLPPNGPGACMESSYAPLENVSQIQIFYDKDGIHCLGMILEYQNGGQRAVGQCRILVDHSETLKRPSSIAFVNVERPPRSIVGSHWTNSPHRVKVRFGGPSGDEDEWSHYTMAGTLVFWFTLDQAHVSVEGGIKIPHDSQ